MASRGYAAHLSVVAGGGTGGDGTPAARAKVVTPFGIDFAPDGDVYFVEMVNGERLRTIDAHGMLQTLAGTGAKGSSGDGGPGLQATFNGMHSLAVGADGVVYLADTWNRRIRTYDPKTSLVQHFAGTGAKGFAGDGGPAVRATFGDVYCIALDGSKEKLYVADLDNRRIRVIDLKTRVVSTIAGTGARGIPSDDALAAKSPLVDPRAVAVARDGKVFVLERGGHALRMINPEDGRLRTVVGTGRAGAGLADGVANRVQLDGPKHLCIDYRDEPYSVLIADTENHRILRYSANAVRPKVEVIAGTGRRGSAIVEPEPLRCQLFQPHGVAVHPKSGAIYIADSMNNRILKIDR